MANQFIVLDKVINEVQFDNLVVTAHWREDRMARHEKIKTIIGDGSLIASFEVYTAHPNGNEIHNVFNNGIVLIQNKDSKRLVTELIARPQQIRRYWEQLCKAYPSQLYGVIDKARTHQRLGYNNW